MSAFACSCLTSGRSAQAGRSMHVPNGATGSEQTPATGVGMEEEGKVPHPPAPRNNMDHRLQAHVLENILNNGGWTWGWEREILSNPDALDWFETSNFTRDDYFACTVMLVESSKVVERERHPDNDTTHSPFCLTLDGLQHLKDLQHPVREWLKRNWFATVVAITTSLTAVAATVFNVVIHFVGA